MAKHIQMPPIYPIPQNWTWVELRQLTRIISGYPFDSKLFSDLNTTGRPLIRIRDVVRGYTETYTTEDCPNQYIIHKNDILIGMDGDFNVGKWQNEDALLNQRVCFIQSVSDLLLNDYLFYFLPKPLKQINDVTPSVTVKHLSTKTIESIMIPLPPLEEQKRLITLIESLFAKLDEAKEKAQEVVDGFETRKAAILHKAFSGELTFQWREENNIPTNSWEETKLGYVLREIKYGSSEKSDYSYTGIPVLRIPNIGDMELIFDDLKFLRQNDCLPNEYLEENDILIIRSNGSKDLVGKCAIVKNLDQKYTYASFLIRLRVIDGIYSPYIVWYLNSETARKQLFRKAKSSAGIHNINSKEIADIDITIPLIAEQNKIVETLSALIKKEKQVRETAEVVIDQIDIMKKAILARAFRGELGTNDPSEESAVELLKKVIFGGEN